MEGQLRGLQEIYRSGQPRKTPGFKQEVLFQHQAITTPHSLHCADPSAEHFETCRISFFSWPHVTTSKVTHLKCKRHNVSFKKDRGWHRFHFVEKKSVICLDYRSV